MYVCALYYSFPDVMMESYSVKPLTPVFFVVFLIIGLYIIINVLLATVYGTFKENQKRKFLAMSKRKRYVLILYVASWLNLSTYKCLDYVNACTFHYTAT